MIRGKNEKFENYLFTAILRIHHTLNKFSKGERFFKKITPTNKFITKSLAIFIYNAIQCE